MFNPKTPISGRLKNSSGEWIQISSPNGDDYSCGYFVISGLLPKNRERCESKPSNRATLPQLFLDLSGEPCKSAKPKNTGSCLPGSQR
jgi:hypothetical protein